MTDNGHAIKVRHVSPRLDRERKALDGDDGTELPDGAVAFVQRVSGALDAGAAFIRSVVGLHRMRRRE